MNYLADMDVVIHCGGNRLALEGDHWLVLMRLIRIYGLQPDGFAPEVNRRVYVNSDASQKLVEILETAMDDIPNDGSDHYSAWDLESVSVFDFFSGIGSSYLMEIYLFVDGHEFWLEVEESQSGLF